MNPEQIIVNECPACNTQSEHQYTGESGQYEDCGELISEYLYKCLNCKEKIWL